MPACCLIRQLPKVARTESFQLLIVARRSDVTEVSLIHFILFGRSIHQLLRHDDAPLPDPALKRSQLAPAVTVGITGHQPIKQLGSLRVRLLLKPVQYLAPHPLEGIRSCALPAACSFLRRVRGTNLAQCRHSSGHSSGRLLRKWSRLSLCGAVAESVALMAESADCA